MIAIRVALLLLSAVCAVPASANYFFNRPWGTTTNLGSAPNPTPMQLRAIGDAPYPARRGRPSVAVAQALEFYARLGARVNTVTIEPVVVAIEAPALATSTKTGVMTRTAMRQEKGATATLNRASLVQARAIAAEATTVKAASVKRKRPVKEAEAAAAAKAPRS